MSPLIHQFNNEDWKYGYNKIVGENNLVIVFCIKINTNSFIKSKRSRRNSSFINGNLEKFALKRIFKTQSYNDGVGEY